MQVLNVEFRPNRGAELVRIRLPNLAATNCGALIVCGPVQTTDSSTLKWMKQQRSILTRYRSGDESVYAYAVFGGDPESTLHLEASLGPSLPTQKKAERVKKSDFQSVIERLRGERIDSGIEGFFLVEKKDMPPIIKTAIVETKADGVSIKSISGELSVRGAPISAIQWHVSDEGDALVRLRARRMTVIDESYLESSLNLVDSAFITLVRGGQKDVQR